jgi:hypothetical protein
MMHIQDMPGTPPSFTLLVAINAADADWRHSSLASEMFQPPKLAVPIRAFFVYSFLGCHFT